MGNVSKKLDLEISPTKTAVSENRVEPTMTLTAQQKILGRFGRPPAYIAHGAGLTVARDGQSRTARDEFSSILKAARKK